MSTTRTSSGPGAPASTARRHWRTGGSWLAFALLAAAAARLGLPDHDAGMLRVRSKVLDAGILIAMGIAILVLAGTIPDQPV